MSTELKNDVYNAALVLLSRREHSALELSQKLERKFARKIEDYGSEASLESATASTISALQERAYQSDERFTETFVAYRSRSGKGPMRISQELKERGIADDLIMAVVRPESERWIELAGDLKQRRFGADTPEVNEAGVQRQKERAKQMRFLQYRGFTYDQISRALNP